MKKHNLLRNAVHFALTAGVASSFAGVAYAADEDAAQQDKITVTGSRISRVDIEGPAPVTVISREDIDASGDISVAEVLRGTTFNSFGSFKPSSGSSAQSQATVSLRGLGSARTLVLLDGRRLANAPAFGGTAQNLNTIPLAAVERVEILRDGASAIYGSDAIAGVINVILRKDFEGLNMRAGVGKPTRDGGDEASGSIVGGISSARGNLLFALDHDEQGMIFNGDRDFSKLGTSSFGFPGTAVAYDDGGVPGSFSGGFVNFFPDARCPDRGPGAAQVFDGSAFQDSDVSGGICRFNYARTSANEASIRKDSLFVNGTFEVSDDINFFARATVARTNSFGRYAPTPTVGGSPFAPTMSSTNPNNPTQGVTTDTDGDGISDFTGPFDISIFYRNVPGGFRDNFIEDVLFDSAIGLQGSADWFGGSDWELAVQHSRATTYSTSTGNSLRPLQQAAIDSGAFDPFNVQGLIPDGVNPAIDDCGQPCDDFRAVAQSFRADGYVDNETTFKGFDGNISFDAFQMENGPVPLVFGFEYADEFYSQDYDALQNAGAVDGSAGGNDTIGSRSRYSVFGETMIPLMDTLNLNLALRYDSYSDFGSTTNPKIAFEFRPMDTLLIRAGYGEGFRAPSLTDLYGSPAQSFDGAIDTFRCNTVGAGVPGAAGLPPGDPCKQTQYQNYSGGNLGLDAEQSESFNVGFVWNPTADFNMGIEYYDISYDQQITTIPLQTIFNNEDRGDYGTPGSGTVGSGTISAQCGAGSPVKRNGTGGSVSFICAGAQNLSGVETNGIDVDAEYRFGFDGMGDFSVAVQASRILDYDTETNPGSGFNTIFTAAGTPDTRANLIVNWTGGDFGASLIGEHIAGDDAAIVTNGGFNSYTTWSAQFTYDTPWNGKVSVGARNLFDELPPTNTAFSHPYYSNALHDVYGRVPYIRYEQDL
ncbi:MAG: TonB-dependent receptor [Gammaproteobacteria bacterium]|nr:TonB-dependent receptor [Gammaproteobacteria bacterium]